MVSFIQRAYAYALASSLASSSRISTARRDERGQAVTEYVLLLLGVVTVALAVTAWAAQSGKIGALLDRVFNEITSRIE